MATINGGRCFILYVANDLGEDFRPRDLRLPDVIRQMDHKFDFMLQAFDIEMLLIITCGEAWESVAALKSVGS